MGGGGGVLISSYLNDRKLFSTITAVLDVSEIILEEMNKKKFVGAVLIDLKKSFWCRRL